MRNDHSIGEEAVKANSFKTYFSSVTRAGLATLACGFIGYVWSERIFWTVWRPVESAFEPFVVWLAYSSVAGIFFHLWLVLKPSHWTTVLFLGAVYGWLAEGGLVATLYGTEESAPFPASIVITGLSWHALLAIGFGFWGFGSAMQSVSIWPSVGTATLAGLFWGLWGMFPWAESPPMRVSAAHFFAHSFICSLGLVIAWSTLLAIGKRKNLRPSLTILILSIGFISLFYFVQAAELGAIVLLLPLLLLGAIASAIRSARLQHRVTWELSRIRPRFIGCLLWIPFAATAMYMIAGEVGADRWHIPVIVYYWLTAPIATILMLSAIYKTWIVLHSS